MATRKAEVTIIECDAPDCTTQIMGDEWEVEILIIGWYLGEVLHHHSGGGSGGTWHACKVAHIRGAVLEAVDRD